MDKSMFKSLATGSMLNLQARCSAVCKYGENAWQTPAGLFSETDGTDDPLALGRFERIEGSEPSYNNYCDLDRALQTMTHIAAVYDLNYEERPSRIAIGIKHGNACGACVSDLPREYVMSGMISGDPRAIFGGVIITNFAVDGASAEKISSFRTESKRVVDLVAAPVFTDEAIALLRREKTHKCRLLVNPALEHVGRASLDVMPRFRHVRGGCLAQPNYTFVPDFKSYGVDHGFRYDLALAWAVGSTSNSNTITIVHEGTLLGNGTGQQDRVGACELALKRARDAGHDVTGAVAYSDSFFPFVDGPEVLAQAGIRAILTSSGSRNDDQVRERLAARGVTVYFMPDAEARGFFGH